MHYFYLVLAANDLCRIYVCVGMTFTVYVGVKLFHTHMHTFILTQEEGRVHIYMLSFLCEVIFELVIAPNSTQVFVSNCVFVKRHLPHTSVPPVFFIILLTVVTSFTSQKSVVCCQNYYVVVSTNSSMKGFNYIIDQKTTKQKPKKKNLGNICRLSVARFLFCLLLWHLFKIRALSCVRFH